MNNNNFKHQKTEMNKYDVRFKKMREEYKNSYFLPEGFDYCIIGINPLTKSIVYHYTGLGIFWLEQVENIFEPDEVDKEIACKTITQWIDELKKKESLDMLEGKIAPTLIVPDFELYN